MSTKGLIPETAKTRLVDDFLGRTLDADKWLGHVGSNGSIISPTLVAGDLTNGRVLMRTGNDAGGTLALNGVQLDSNLNWICNRGGLMCEFYFRIQGAAMTNMCWFVGFTDQVSALEMPFTLSGTTLTSNASNAVGFLFDTDATVDNWWAVGVADDVDATQQDIGFAPVADTFQTLRVEVNRSGAATFRRNGSVIGTAMTGAVQGPTSSDLMTPVAVGFARAASVRTMEIDYIVCEQNRP